MNELFDKLNELINKYENFILIGHKDPDLDVLGSCLALYNIIKNKNKNPYIFIDKDNLDKYNESIIKSLNKVEFNYVNEKTYKNYLKNTLLIIVDVHQQERLEYPNILENKIDIVVIDHHIMYQNYMEVHHSQLHHLIFCIK